MNQETLYQELKHLLTILQRISKVKKTSNSAYGRDRHPLRDMELFMDRTINIYIALKTNSFIEADPKFQDYIQKSAHKLIRMHFDLYCFLSYIEYALDLTFYHGNEWIDACWKRSAFEALKEMHQNTILGTVFEEDVDLDTEDVDELMEWKGGFEGYLSKEEIPLGIPSSHWWWWYPEKPPETRES